MEGALEVLATGYELVEAPRADEQGRVWFTDVLGGGVYRWDDGAVETMVAKRRGVGGLVLHRDGGAVIGGRDIRHVAADGTQRLLLETPAGVTGFNDLCATPTGGIVAGGLRFRPFGGEEPVPGGFWRLEAGAPAPTEVLTGISWPNGCGFSGDALLACDYHTGTVHVVDAAGARPFATSPSGEADGLAVDAEGGVWVATGSAGGLARFSPGGALDLVLDGLAEFVTSVAFSADGTTLYVTTAARREPGVLGRLPAPVPGRAHLLASL
jgi:gluconolactonase